MSRRDTTPKYTICFCRWRDRILMLLRTKPPNAGKWNGLGGKIEPGESPLHSVRREVMEEAGIDLGLADRVRATGLVTWTIEDGPSIREGGMYAFVAEFPESCPLPDGEWTGPEGLLHWEPIAWVCDATNLEVVDNIARFLPSMLSGDGEMVYRCEYRGNRLVDVSAGVAGAH